MLEALRLEEVEIKAAQAATKEAETKDTSKKLEPSATGRQTAPDSGMVKGKQYDSFGDVIVSAPTIVPKEKNVEVIPVGVGGNLLVPSDRAMAEIMLAEPI